MRDGASSIFGGVDTGGELLDNARICRYTQASRQRFE
jgi:hypothetical protein